MNNLAPSPSCQVCELVHPCTSNAYMLCSKPSSYASVSLCVILSLMPTCNPLYCAWRCMHKMDMLSQAFATITMPSRRAWAINRKLVRQRQYSHVMQECHDREASKYIKLHCDSVQHTGTTLVVSVSCSLRFTRHQVQHVFRPYESTSLGHAMMPYHRPC